MALVHACIPLVVDCGFQPMFAYAIIGHAIFFWVMFLNFYRKRYNEDGALDGAEVKVLHKTTKQNSLNSSTPTNSPDQKLTHRKEMSIHENGNGTSKTKGDGHHTTNLVTSFVENTKNR